MEDRKILKSILLTLQIAIVVIISFVFSSATALSYDTSTHKNLHQNIINKYIRITEKQIPQEEIQAFLEGAISEDNDPRYLNHFYDPVHNRGLEVGVGYKKKYPTSILWVQYPTIQEKLKGKNKPPLFEGDNDYSFPRAVYEYVHGDRKRQCVH